MEQSETIIYPKSKELNLLSNNRNNMKYINKKDKHKN